MEGLIDFFSGYGVEELMEILLVALFFFKPGFNLLQYLKGSFEFIVRKISNDSTFALSGQKAVLLTQAFVWLITLALMLVTETLNLADFDFTLRSLLELAAIVWAASQYAWARFKEV